MPSARAAAWVSSISSTGWALPTLKMIASRCSWGMTSRKSSIRLPARLAAWSDSPVTLPPRCRLPYCRDSAADGDNYVHLQTDKFCRDFCITLGATLRPAILDSDVTVLDPAQFAQMRDKGGRPWTEGRSICAQESYGRQLSRLLRARSERPCCRAAEQCDELAPPHSITSLANASSRSGTLRPSAFAVLRLITSSNLVGCWTGRSDALVPLRILST